MSDDFPEWMAKAGSAMRARADKTMNRPKHIGTMSCNSIRELYRKHTAKQMATWIAAREGLQDQELPKNPDKLKLFKEMYPVLVKWMEDKGFSIKTGNVTAKAKAALALAVSVKVIIYMCTNYCCCDAHSNVF